jgi:hypothetical protein
MTENCKLHKAILSAFYNISQRNFGILLILWCSFKLWWNFCPYLPKSNFHSKGERSIETNLPCTLGFLILNQFLLFTFKNWKKFYNLLCETIFQAFLHVFLYFCYLHSWQTAIFWDQWDDHPYTMRPRYLMNFRLR